MGRNFVAVEGLSSPLSRVYERVMLIPRGQRLVVENPHHKLVILLEGEVHASVDDQELGHMKPRDVLIVPGVCRQAYVPVNPARQTRLQALVVIFDRHRFVYDSVSRRSVLAVQDGERGQLADLVQRRFGTLQLLPNAVSVEALHWIDLLRDAALSRREDRTHRIEAFTLLVLTELRQGTSVPVPETNVSRHRAMAEEVKAYLLEHYWEDLSLDKIGWHLNLSAEHLARVFRRETGQTVFGYINRLRLEQAKSLLAGSKMTVGEIAARTGMGNATLFCRNFKRATGLTPIGFRRIAEQQNTFSPGHYEPFTL